MYKNYEDVLKVELVSYTQPPPVCEHGVPYLDVMNDSVIPLIAWCARVSNPANQNNHETADKLINYLVDHKHWSPLQMVNICVEITSTRDIVRQLLRHQSFAFQEFSQRYADTAALEDQFVIRECRMQDQKNRQNSIDTDNEDIKDWWKSHQIDLIDFASYTYKAAIKMGIAKEQARVILPEGNTVSRIIVNGSARSWVHYFEARIAEGVQKEHRLMAAEIAKVINTVFNLKRDN